MKDCITSNFRHINSSDYRCLMEVNLGVNMDCTILQFGTFLIDHYTQNVTLHTIFLALDAFAHLQQIPPCSCSWHSPPMHMWWIHYQRHTLRLKSLKFIMHMCSMFSIVLHIYIYKYIQEKYTYSCIIQTDDTGIKQLIFLHVHHHHYLTTLSSLIDNVWLW